MLTFDFCRSTCRADTTWSGRDYRNSRNSRSRNNGNSRNNRRPSSRSRSGDNWTSGARPTNGARRFVDNDNYYFDDDFTAVKEAMNHLAIAKDDGGEVSWPGHLP
jgi:hypothetical protein